jgi:hypothetical protein
MIKETTIKPNTNLENNLYKKEFSEIPEGYVSVFHEVKDMGEIGKEGLKTLDKIIDKILQNTEDKEQKEWVARVIDEVRPSNLKQAGISRFNIFAYPDNPKVMGSYFGRHKILEILVDPRKCYVLEMDKYGRAWDDLNLELSKANSKVAAEYNNDLTLIKSNTEEFRIKIAEERAKINREEVLKKACIDNGYWDSAVTLEDFNKYYEKSDLDFKKRKDAPENLPLKFSEPEVLIPEDIPIKHIKLTETD